MLDTFADHVIQSQQVACGNTFSIRRVGNHDTRLRGFRILLERQYFQVDVFSKSGTADILLGNLDGCRVDIRSVAFESELAFIAFIVIDTVEQLLQAVDVAVEMNKDGALGISVPNYVDENVSVKVVKLIQSYTGVVNKMVWRKY